MAASTSPLLTTFTTLQLILIVAVAVLVVFGMIWGVGAKRRRRAQMAEIDTVEEGSPGALADDAVEPVGTAGAPPPPPSLTHPAPPPGEDDAPGKIAEPPAAGAPAGGDLTTLKGLGPKVAARLNDLGIRGIADLAALSPGEADRIDGELGPFAGRLKRDRWVEQAGYLAGGDRAGFEAAFGRLGG